MPRFEVPDGWCVQAFRFTLDPTEEQTRALARHFGARRKAYNWTVAALKADIEAWHAEGVETAKPSLRVLRKRWNTVKNEVCVHAETGVVWWPECSKEAYTDGIAGAVDAYWNWQQSRSGKRAGKRVGFPHFKRKGRDADRVCFTTGAMRVEPDRRHLTLPVIGTVRTHENPRPLDGALRELRHVSRARSRCVKGSRRYRERTVQVSRLHRRVNDIRTHHLHVLTARLAKTHGRIVVEGLDAAAMLRQKGLPGARARRRGPSDAALGTPRRHLSYKTGWYGSALVVADRWFPSSRTCHGCGHVQDIGWDEHWQCDGCSTSHQRDDNAAVNLARYEEPVSVVGPVGAAVKRGADRKTGPVPAGGHEARKGTGHPAGEQPRDGVRVA